MFMKKIITMIASLLAAVLALTFTAFADDTKYSYGHFYYHDHDGYVSIAGYLGSETDIEIPSSIAGKPVSEIESGAFVGCGSIERITVPDTVVMVYPESFTGAGALQKIICESEISGITAPAGVEIVQPEVTTVTTTAPPPVQSSDTSDSTGSSSTTGYQPPVWSDSVSGSSWGNDPIITSASSYEDTTQPVVHSEISQDEDIGDFAYEEDFMPDEAETVITASEKETSESRSTTAKDKTTSKDNSGDSALPETVGVTTSSVTAAVTVPENIVSVSVNDAGNLVGIDESGSETVLDTDKTYMTEQQPDGSVKIVDDNGEEVVIAEETTAAAQPAEPETQPELPSPSQESEQFNVVPIIIIIVAGAAVIALVAVIILIRKRK